MNYSNQNSKNKCVGKTYNELMSSQMPNPFLSNPFLYMMYPHLNHFNMFLPIANNSHFANNINPNNNLSSNLFPDT
jgi:hypothetical protein